MGAKTGISWTDSTWNPWVGCKKVSAGCKNCYMFREQEQYGHDPKLIRRTSDATFFAPINKKDFGPLVFTCSWSDFFIEEADEWRDEAWDVIRRTPHLTYQILTKRVERVQRCLPSDWGNGYPNVWLGISAENQEMYDKRKMEFFLIPSVVRFLSIEPFIGPIELGLEIEEVHNSIHWIITGGESGPWARMCPVEWVRNIRRRCAAYDIPFFHKQWGSNRIDGMPGGCDLDGRIHHAMPKRWKPSQKLVQ